MSGSRWVKTCLAVALSVMMSSGVLAAPESHDGDADGARPQRADTSQPRQQPQQNRQGQQRQQSAQQKRKKTDKNRANLRQQLLNDRASYVQQKALEHKIQGETEEERKLRQRAYEQSARERGEELMILGDMSSNDDMRTLGEWAQGESLEEMRRMRIQKYEQEKLGAARRAALKNWATGQSDIAKAREQAREKTREDRQHERRRNEANRIANQRRSEQSDNKAADGN